MIGGERAILQVGAAINPFESKISNRYGAPDNPESWPTYSRFKSKFLFVFSMFNSYFDLP
jgi:hypothetical protein